MGGGPKAQAPAVDPMQQQLEEERKRKDKELQEMQLRILQRMKGGSAGQLTPSSGGDSSLG